jgi:hypothetical protein
MHAGGGPPDPKNIAFFPSRRRNKADRFISQRGIIGLVGFTEPDSPIRAPLGRFRVGSAPDYQVHFTMKKVV